MWRMNGIVPSKKREKERIRSGAHVSQSVFSARLKYPDGKAEAAARKDIVLFSQKKKLLLQREL